MSGTRRLQRNGYQRVRKTKGPYDEYPLAVREFLEICEGIARRMLVEKEEEERADKCLQLDQQEQESLRK